MQVEATFLRVAAHSTSPLDGIQTSGTTLDELRSDHARQAIGFRELLRTARGRDGHRLSLPRRSR